MSDQPGNTTVAVAGDLRGHLIGTVSNDEGSVALADAEIGVRGSTPTGPWSYGAESDCNGFFRVALPLGTVGNVHIKAVKDKQCAEADVDSKDIAKGLTPRPLAGSTSRLSLEGVWDFVTDPPEDFPSELDRIKWSKINVPSHWVMAGFAAESGLGLYRKTFQIPQGWSGKRIKFRSEGIYSRAEVWVNGKRAGSHDGGATPFQLDITAAAQPSRDNEIVVLVAGTSDAGNLDAMSYYAHFDLAGIWRPLEVFCVDPVHISRLALATDFDEDYRDAELAVDVDIANEQPREVGEASLKLSVMDPQGELLALGELCARVSLGPWELQHVSLRAKVSKPEQWSAESPRLYRLIAELTAPDQQMGVIEQSFGFRKVEIRGRTYTVNGRPVKFWGACRHDAHPLHGRAITADVVKQDIELMKGANLNAFRTSHYPPHPAAIEFADQYGLYVEDEAPFCFVSVSYGPETGRQRNLAEDLRLAPLVISLTSQLVERDRNHPSVVVWSQCNESKYGAIFALAREFIKESDPTRPISAGQSANLNLATYHCPTNLQRIEDSAGSEMPVLFDEAFPIFQGFGAQAQGMDLDPGLRDYWVTAHFEPLKALLQSEHQFGAMIWAWVDDAFLVPGKGIEYGRRNLPQPHFVDRVYSMPGRGIKGDPSWGVIDGWRRPRPEWWLCKKLFSPIQVKEHSLTLPGVDEPISVDVENRNVFVGLDQYLCRWQLASEGGQVRPHVAPLSKGAIVISPGRPPSADDTLILEFFDQFGKMIDGALLRFKPHARPNRPKPRRAARIIEEPTELTFASIIRLVGRNAELAFDRTSGLLARGLAGHQQVLRGGPKLHLMKSTAPVEVYPDGWHFAGAEYHEEAGQAVLRWNGRYGSDFKGGFEIRMDDAGYVQIAYNFAYSGAELTAREIGISLNVPLACDTLEWDRRAEWSYYPDDHIGRPHGVAVAHPCVSQIVPPGDRPFGLDDHPWGSNDFRSTKRHVYWATLTDPSGAGIKVVSNGTQHVRATVSVHTISVKVLDHYGGAATGTSEWDRAAYGNGRTIKTGDAIKGVVNLRLLSQHAASP